MTGPSFAIVCTTIGDGSFLKHYAAAVREAADRVTMFVIPDRKTPAALYAAVEDYRASGLRVECPDLNEQTAFLAKLGAPDGMFGWDTDHRRNVGYLMAYESGADIVVSIDDDNLPAGGWLDEHAGALMPTARMVGSIRSGFFNPCDHLRCEESPRIWARGFPYSQRGTASWWTSRLLEPCDVAINAGLWIGDPDVDAITRLAIQPASDKLDVTEMVLAGDTWAPANSQNTAVRREVIPAYYFFRSPRFGDIYQGYLAQACAKHLGHAVRFGTPVVRHDRNDHDLLRDLEAELPDIIALDPWLDWLTGQAKPSGSTYADVYANLGEQMHELGMLGTDQPDRVRDRAIAMAAQMRQWLRLCQKVN